jgi:hypothetical protein
MNAGVAVAIVLALMTLAVRYLALEVGVDSELRYRGPWRALFVVPLVRQWWRERGQRRRGIRSLDELRADERRAKELEKRPDA